MAYIRHIASKILVNTGSGNGLFSWRHQAIIWTSVDLPSMITSGTYLFAWWRHQMETFSALLALCAGHSPVTGEFPSQRSVTRSFDVFFDLCLNKRLSKQSWGWWLETPSRPLWRHCNGILKLSIPNLCLKFTRLKSVISPRVQWVKYRMGLIGRNFFDGCTYSHIN